MLTRLYTFLILFLILLPVCASAQDLLFRPESVAFDSLRNRYLVNNIGNGNVIAVDTSGVQSIYKSGYGECYGNCIAGDTFYVSDGSTIYGIDMSTDVTFMTHTLPASARSYDGMTTDTSGFLYVVNTGGGIWKIDISTQTSELFALGGLAASTQDIIFDKKNNRLLVAGYSANAPVQVVDIETGDVTGLVYSPMGFFDGITIDHIGNVYLSHSTGGAVYKYDRTFTNPPELISTGQNQPAGLDFNFRDNVLAVPNFGGNSLDLIPLVFSPELEGYIFDDAVGGDGDGIPEPGETIEMTASIINYRTKAITDITMDLTVDDANISIIDGSSSLGSLASTDTTDNSSDPFQFVVPMGYNPRIDSFFLEISYNGGTEVDHYVIEKGIGNPRILLVDDDASDDIENYYIECFSAVRIPYDILETPAAPTVADLENYEIVIWFTGDYRLPLDGDEIAAMEGYMDGGGNLFMTGQGIAALLDLIDTEFMNNYLRADYTMTQLVQGLAAEPTAQVFALSDTVWIAGSIGASNQTATDHLTAINGGVGEMVYLGASGYGAVSYSGAYKSLFMGFGFEAVINGSARWTDRFTVFAEILEFFEYNRPGVSPEINDFAITAADQMHVTDHAPDLSWTYSDLTMSPQTNYQIQVGNDEDWEVSEMWDSGPIPSSVPSAEYAGAELIDGETYYIRARVSSGDYWSSWETIEIKMNSVSLPTNLSPDNFEEVTEGEVSLSHDNIPDSEGDVYTYSYEIYDDDQMSSLLAAASDQPSGTDAISSWVPSVSLDLDEDYYWRVKTDDGYESGQWTELASFILVAAYLCGDANSDDQANVADAVFLINYVFKGGAAPDPVEAGDANCDGQSNVADAVYTINYVFKGGAAPCANCL